MITGNDTREVWLNNFVELARPTFEAAGYPIPYNLRVSIGLPPNGYRSKVIGVCFSPEVSADNHWEIYISPLVSEGDARIADILTHELVHAAADTMGHGKKFGTLARLVGLEGSLTSTSAGAGWFAWAAPILEQLGTMDFAALSAMKPHKKKQTFTLKTECPDCGWLARVTKKHILAHTHLNCPVPDCEGILVTDFGDDDEGE